MRFIMKIITIFCLLLCSSVTQAGIDRFGHEKEQKTTPPSINITTLYAAKPTTVAMELEELKHGVFSWALIETLSVTPSNPSAELTMATITSRVAKKVAEKTNNKQKIQVVSDGAQINSPLCSKQTTYLLSISITKYDEVPNTATLYTKNDINGVAKALKQHCYTIEQTVLMNTEATKANINQQLSKIIVKAKPDDHIIINFAGNGLHINGQSYLLPYDAKMSKTDKKKAEALTDSLLKISSLNKNLQRSQASNGVLLLDICL